MEGIGAFRVVLRTRLNIELYSPLKPSKVVFIFIGPNLTLYVEAKILQLSITVTQAVVKVGSKIMN